MKDAKIARLTEMLKKANPVYEKNSQMSFSLNPKFDFKLSEIGDLENEIIAFDSANEFAFILSETVDTISFKRASIFIEKLLLDSGKKLDDNFILKILLS